MLEDQTIFTNREDAGRRLAKKILDLHLQADIVLAIPRGGVPVGLVVAEILNLPLRLYLVRKIGHPVNSEYAIGAVSENDLLLNAAENPARDYVEKNIKKERVRIGEMKKIFEHIPSPGDFLGKNIIIVDDGIATGTCIALAIKEARSAGARSITVAVPVCPGNTEEKIKPLADRIIVLLRPLHFTGIGAYYQDFSQLTDHEVTDMLKRVADNDDSLVEMASNG